MCFKMEKAEGRKKRRKGRRVGLKGSQSQEGVRDAVPEPTALAKALGQERVRCAPKRFPGFRIIITSSADFFLSLCTSVVILSRYVMISLDSSNSSISILHGVELVISNLKSCKTGKPSMLPSMGSQRARHDLQPNNNKSSVCFLDSNH